MYFVESVQINKLKLFITYIELEVSLLYTTGIKRNNYNEHETEREKQNVQ